MLPHSYRTRPNSAKKAHVKARDGIVSGKIVAYRQFLHTMIWEKLGKEPVKILG